MRRVADTLRTHPLADRALRVVGSRGFRAALTVALVAFGLWQLDLASVTRRLQAAEPAWVVAGLALLLLGQAISGERWRLLAAHFGLTASSRWFVAAYLRGCFYNSVLPTGIGGDAMRIGLVRPLGTWRTATRSVVVDRLTGFAALALAAGLLLPVAGLGLPVVVTTPVAVVAAAGLIAAMTFAATRRLLPWVGWTLAYEAVWFVGVWALARSLDLELAWATPAVVLVVGIAMALPISFGGHGAREAGFVLALTPLGIGADEAVALGVLFGVALALVGLAGAAVHVSAAQPPPTAEPPTQAPPAAGSLAAAATDEPTTRRTLARPHHQPSGHTAGIGAGRS